MSPPRAASKWDGIPVQQLRERWDRDAVFVYGTVDSTNDVARSLAEEGVEPGAIVLAREQKMGRGREGKKWVSPRDAGVYLSMVFRPEDLSHPAPLSILAGLGIAARLDRLFPDLHPAVKWPNDIVADDRKCGGILAEAVSLDAHPLHLVVGVGINVKDVRKQLPKSLRGRAGSLEQALDRRVRLVEVADAIVDGLEAHMHEPPRALPPALLDQLDRFDWLQDRRAELHAPGSEEPLPGTCVGIAPDGALLFRPDRGALRRVQSGTVEAL